MQLLIAPDHFDNPKTLSLDAIAEALERFRIVRVQFSHKDAYGPTLLTQVNDICRIMTDRFQVRFYSHADTGFDASVLDHLPDIKNLALDCLGNVVSEDIVPGLRHLTRLHWGVYNFDRPDFLETFELGRMTQLTLDENRKRSIDLSPLKRALALETLFVEGHAAGLAAIAGLPRLRKIVLRSYGKGNGLQFLRDVPNLEALTLILGGREHLEDLESSTLRDLQVIRVRGVQGLGALSRFPRLRNLRIEDQIKLKVLDLRGADFEKLRIINCKSLHDIAGLDEQDQLVEVVCGYVALDMDKLLDFHWPPSARTVRLASTSNRWNEAAALSLAARGHGGVLSDWWH